MFARTVTIVLVAAATLTACSDNDLGTGYLSYADDLVLCRVAPDPATGACDDVAFDVESWLVLDVHQVDTAPAGDRTISLEQVTLTVGDDVGYRATPVDE